MTRRQRILQRNRTERLSELLDWQSLGKVRNDFVQHLFSPVSVVLVSYSTIGRLGDWRSRG